MLIFDAAIAVEHAGGLYEDGNRRGEIARNVSNIYANANTDAEYGANGEDANGDARNEQLKHLHADDSCARRLTEA